MKTIITNIVKSIWLGLKLNCPECRKGRLIYDHTEYVGRKCVSTGVYRCTYCGKEFI